MFCSLSSSNCASLFEVIDSTSNPATNSVPTPTKAPFTVLAVLDRLSSASSYFPISLKESPTDLSKSLNSLSSLFISLPNDLVDFSISSSDLPNLRISITVDFSSFFILLNNEDSFWYASCTFFWFFKSLSFSLISFISWFLINCLVFIFCWFAFSSSAIALFKAFSAFNKSSSAFFASLSLSIFSFTSLLVFVSSVLNAFSPSAVFVSSASENVATPFAVSFICLLVFSLTVRNSLASFIALV